MSELYSRRITQLAHLAREQQRLAGAYDEEVAELQASGLSKKEAMIQVKNGPEVGAHIMMLGLLMQGATPEELQAVRQILAQEQAASELAGSQTQTSI